MIHFQIVVLVDIGHQLVDKSLIKTAECKSPQDFLSSLFLEIENQFSELRTGNLFKLIFIFI
jgi:hypothetical protein